MNWLQEHFVNVLGLLAMVATAIIGYWKLHSDLTQKVVTIEKDLSDFHEDCNEHHKEYEKQIQDHIDDDEVHSHRGVSDLKSANVTQAISELKLEIKETGLMASRDMRELEAKLSAAFHAEHDRTRVLLSAHIMDATLHQSEGEKSFRVEWRENVMNRLTRIEQTISDLHKFVTGKQI